MGKGSISDSLSLVPIEVPEGLERLGQKLFFSGGEGYNFPQPVRNTTSKV